MLIVGACLAVDALKGGRYGSLSVVSDRNDGEKRRSSTAFRRCRRAVVHFADKKFVCKYGRRMFFNLSWGLFTYYKGNEFSEM